jgi:hypothetical protein
LDAAGKTILAEARLPARFQFTRSSAIVVAGITVGSIEHDAPLDSLLATTGRIVQPSARICTIWRSHLLLRVLDWTLIDLAGANKTIHQKNADLENHRAAARR